MNPSGCHFIKRFPKGITLFEMTIVLTVTLILSVLFIYSTSHLVVKTKIERVKEEHRVLSRALQNYRMDYNDYPSQIYFLNAPTAYLSRIPSDPFRPHVSDPTYKYYFKPTEDCDYVIISAGPDNDLDLEAMVEKYMMNASSSPASEGNAAAVRNDIMKAILPIYLATKVYDPTNGIVSDGDIITFSNK
ncbi:MAG: Bacterial type II secretion system protein G [candidate division BRC1 bacterium ADurb.Bin183]|nr:MAG: Bacterial type II secretion system protein G [candidate division BRC1 bacterium ADurb.Bin183]